MDLTTFGEARAKLVTSIRSKLVDESGSSCRTPILCINKKTKILDWPVMIMKCEVQYIEGGKYFDKQY